jgi:hypothetical protein
LFLNYFHFLENSTDEWEFRYRQNYARFRNQAMGRQPINTPAQTPSHTDRIELIRQTIKWIVYSLLIVNWGYYIYDDWRVAQHTLVAGDSIQKYLNAYATALDELAWFAMLFLFEAETYWLDEEAMTRLKRQLFVALRFACYAFLAHTVYAYIFNYYELTQAPILTAVSSVCELSDQDFSFVRNLAYSVINANNCDTLSLTTTLYQIGGDQVVTDFAGLNGLKLLYAVDIEDAIVWLGVVLLIELVVLVQEKGISEGPLINGCNYLTIALYCVLICNAMLWFWKGHWVYGWDELLWIGGFAAIEMNLSEWRDELKEEAASA